MSRNVLIAPDKFKGTLTAQQAAAAIAKGWSSVYPEDRLELLPISDGGDGFGQVVSDLIGAREQQIKTVDAARRPCLAPWWWEPRSKTAIIESAKVIGLAMLPPGQFHPFELDTGGLGQVLEAAASRGARRCIVGIGGSATNDGGFGMARTLGWKFSNAAGEEIQRWTELHSLREIKPPRRKRLFPQLWVAVDVQNRFLGPKGATRIYGPQKGIRPEDFAPSEKALGRLANAMKKLAGKDFAKLPGTGAAGGLGFGLAAFLGAELRPGFELFARYAKLKGRLKAADLVITGEGSIDHSSLMGKGVGELAACCGQLQIPCLGLGGVIGDAKLLKKSFALALGIAPQLAEPADARARAGFWLTRLAANAARKYQTIPR